MNFFKDFGSGNPTPGNHWLPGMAAFIAGGTLAYHYIGFRLFRRQVESVLSQRPWWGYLKTYKGLFCADVQKEVQYISVLNVHHLISGGIMAYGTYTQAQHIWNLGAMIGLLDDVHDTICMLLPAWPFGGKGEKRDVKLISIMLVHHFAAIACTIPAMLNGLHHNLHTQAIGAWLLLAGGISHGTLLCSRTCNRKNPADAKLDALIWIFGGAFYTYSRLYAFPMHLHAMYTNDYAALSPMMQKCFLSFAGLMSTFNLLIFSDVLGNTIKRIKLVLTGEEKHS